MRNRIKREREQPMKREVKRKVERSIDTMLSARTTFPLPNSMELSRLIPRYVIPSTVEIPVIRGIEALKMFLFD